jgi:hypothetical protein
MVKKQFLDYEMMYIFKTKFVKKERMKKQIQICVNIVFTMKNSGILKTQFKKRKSITFRINFGRILMIVIFPLIFSFNFIKNFDSFEINLIIVPFLP